MTRLVPLGGFLGAGKTTTMIRLAQELQARGEVVAAVTNDQGTDLVDSSTAADAGVAAGEVTGGCFCCRFEDLAAVVERLIETHHPTVVLAEAVGSCTDLQSTVLRPLRALHGELLQVAPLVTLVDPQRYLRLRTQFGPDGQDATDLAHLYHHQLAEADVLAVNKVDTLTAGERAAVVDDLRARFPRTPVLACSAATGAGLAELLAVCGDPAPGEPGPAGPASAGPVPFAVDYRRYGAAEAELAWTNQVWDVRGAFTADDWLAAFLAGFADAVRPAEVGHVKVRVATARGVAKASLVATGAPPRHDRSTGGRSDRATALVNARVATEPATLDRLVIAAAAAADRACTSHSVRVRGEAFRPGFPVPRHRM